MSLTMSQADSVTVLTLTTYSDSRWPPFFQVLKSLCYSPVCCSVSQQLRTSQKTSLSVLGALQIIIGLLNFGLGAILDRSGWIRYSCWERHPYWFGALFIAFGIMCILSEKYPSPCLVILNVILNLAGVAFAITAIVFYSIGVSGAYYLWWLDCERRNFWPYATTQRPSPEDEYIRESCLTTKNLIVMLLRSISCVLLVLSVLELCVAVSSAVLGIKALKSKEQNKSSCEPEQFKPLLEEVTTTSAD